MILSSQIGTDMARTQAIEVSRVRPAAVAGSFYPGDGGALARLVDDQLAAARRFHIEPKALIAPHAGFVYSGAIAATAYATLEARRARIGRVVLLGPCHRVGIAGFAVPTHEAFATPLGLVPVDREGVARALEVPGVELRDDTHEAEHCLETQLPFLQRVLGPFAIVPIVVGAASVEATERLLEALWGGEETLVVVSSDLSHYHDYEAARRLDGAACRSIETLAYDKLGDEQACGRHAIKGLLARARSLDLRATTLDLRSSGDTAGSGQRDRVVGYAAVGFEAAARARLAESDRAQLLSAAAETISRGLTLGKPPQVAVESYPRTLQAVRASFTTLKTEGRLRGCVGSLTAHQPLIADVVTSSYKAAFGDRRFAALSRDELAGLDDRLEVEISILSHARPLPAASEAEALERIRPGRDGLILRDGDKGGVLLPQVWEAIPEPGAFLAALRCKAGLAEDHWSETLTLKRFGTESFGATLPVGG